LKKIYPIFLNVAQTVSTAKLNLKAQNIYIKPLLKPSNTYNKRVLKLLIQVKNVINLLKQKVANNVTISLGYLIFSKKHNEPPKVAQLTKNCPIWSPWTGLKQQLSFGFWSTKQPLSLCLSLEGDVTTSPILFAPMINGTN
jgi:hypothetical protein